MRLKAIKIGCWNTHDMPPSILCTILSVLFDFESYVTERSDPNIPHRP